MAVPVQTPSKEYTANGITTAFPLEFDCDKAEYLIVTLDGNEAPVGSWSLFSNTVTFLTAPVNGTVVLLERNTPYQRTTNYQSYDNSFRPTPVNKDFDLIWWKLQELGYRDQVIWLALVKEISDRINGDENLQTQIDEIDTWLENLQENVNQNTADIAQLVTDLSKEIADRITGDQILKDMFLSMIDEAINEGTINALAITHVDSFAALEAISNVWDGRTIYVKDEGNYRYDALTLTWKLVYQNKLTRPIPLIAGLYDLNPRDGDTVFVKSYHNPDLLIEQRPYKGGGHFYWDAASTSSPDGGTIFQVPGKNVGRWKRLECSRITVEMFGAKGDAVTDDRPAFQNAINYLHSNRGGTLFVPTPLVEYYWKSYDLINSACLVIPSPKRGIYVDPINIVGECDLTMIKVDLGVGVLIEAAILLKGGGLYKKFENLSVYGGKDYNNKNCKYVFKGVDTFYPNLSVNNCQFYVATEYCFYVQTFVSVFNKLQTAYSKRGIVVDGFGNPQTSITLNSCYALNHDHYGYWFAETTYCTFNSCASDHIINNLGDGVEAYPYYIDIARGVTFNGSGAESSTRILHVRSAQGLTINGLMTLSIGDNTNPPNQLIRIDGGSSTVIGGLYNQNPKGFKFKLKLGNAISAESVTVLDQSISPSEVEFSPNFRFDNPIRFLLWDYSRKTQDVTLVNTGDPTTNTTNFNNAIKNAYDVELLHDVIIRFPSGDFEINSPVYLSSAMTRGQGRIRLIGNADGTSRLVVNSTAVLSFGRATTLSRLNYTVENLNLYTLNGSTRGILFTRSDVTFINSKLTSDNGVKQWAGDRTSSITLDANSLITTSMFSPLEIKYSYKSTAAPTTSTRLPVGTRFDASDPNATRIGWINTTDNGLSWLAINPT